MDLDSFLVSLYVLVDNWWQVGHARAPSRPDRPALPTDPEVITLAILAQWPRFRSERDFWRFAWAHLREEYFPKLCSQGQFNRRVRALEPELRALQRSLADELSDPSGRLPRDGHDPRPGHRAGEGFPQGALLRAGHLRQERLQDRMGLRLQGGPGGRSWGRHHRLRAGRGLLRREAHSRRPCGRRRHEAYLADKGFTGVEWERRWLEEYGA